MIYLYSGTPGSGKSLHAAKTIVEWCKRGKGVICNFPVDVSHVKRIRSNPIYLDNSQISVDSLTDYARSHHRVGKESQTLVVIDEAQVKFNAREFQVRDRQKWCTFFSMHRHYGFDFILICQFDRMLDRQIRCLIETEYKHRKLNNYGFGGTVLQLLTLNHSWFICIEYWYGGNKLKLGNEIFPYKKMYGKIYNTFALFDDSAQLVDAISGEKIDLSETNAQKELRQREEFLLNLRFWAPPFV